MLRRERRVVHLVREHGAALARLGERQAALVPLLDAALDAAIERGEDDLERSGAGRCLVEERRRAEPRARSRCRPPR